jgi:hypothetical protein
MLGDLGIRQKLVGVPRMQALQTVLWIGLPPKPSELSGDRHHCSHML